MRSNKRMTKTSKMKRVKRTKRLRILRSKHNRKIGGSDSRVRERFDYQGAILKVRADPRPGDASWIYESRGKIPNWNLSYRDEDVTAEDIAIRMLAPSMRDQLVALEVGMRYSTDPEDLDPAYNLVQTLKKKLANAYAILELVAPEFSPLSDPKPKGKGYGLV